MFLKVLPIFKDVTLLLLFLLISCPMRVNKHLIWGCSPPVLLHLQVDLVSESLHHHCCFWSYYSSWSHYLQIIFLPAFQDLLLFRTEFSCSFLQTQCFIESVSCNFSVFLPFVKFIIWSFSYWHHFTWQDLMLHSEGFCICGFCIVI